MRSRIETNYLAYYQSIRKIYFLIKRFMYTGNASGFNPVRFHIVQYYPVPYENEEVLKKTANPNCLLGQ